MPARTFREAATNYVWNHPALWGPAAAVGGAIGNARRAGRAVKRNRRAIGGVVALRQGRKKRSRMGAVTRSRGRRRKRTYRVRSRRGRGRRYKRRTNKWGGNYHSRLTRKYGRRGWQHTAKGRHVMKVRGTRGFITMGR